MLFSGVFEGKRTNVLLSGMAVNHDTKVELNMFSVLAFHLYTMIETLK